MDTYKAQSIRTQDIRKKYFANHWVRRRYEDFKILIATITLGSLIVAVLCGALYLLTFLLFSL